METLLTFGSYALTALGAVVATLAALAPVTATPWDNKALAALRWVEKVLRLVIPAKPAPALPAAKGEAPAGQPKGTGKIRAL